MQLPILENPSTAHVGQAFPPLKAAEDLAKGFLAFAANNGIETPGLGDFRVVGRMRATEKKTGVGKIMPQVGGQLKDPVVVAGRGRKRKDVRCEPPQVAIQATVGQEQFDVPALSFCNRRDVVKTEVVDVQVVD